MLVGPYCDIRELRPWQTRTHCCGHIVADTNVPRLPARATFVADTNFVSGTQKMFLILLRNILCPQQMFPSLRSPRNIMGNNVSTTMCPRLPGPLVLCTYIIFYILWMQRNPALRPTIKYDHLLNRNCTNNLIIYWSSKPLIHDYFNCVLIDWGEPPSPYWTDSWWTQRTYKVS